VLGANDRKMQKLNSSNASNLLVGPRDHFLDNAGMSESDSDQEAIEEGMLIEAPVTPEKSLAAQGAEGSCEDSGKATEGGDGSSNGSGKADGVAERSDQGSGEADGMARVVQWMQPLPLLFHQHHWYVTSAAMCTVRPCVCLNNVRLAM